MKALAPVCALACVILLVGSSSAQTDRYELGQRLKALETLWNEKKPDEATRKKILAPLTHSVTSFFSARLGEAGRSLDEARLGLLSDSPPSSAQKWTAALSLRPQTRLMDVTAKELPVELFAFYPPNNDAPKDAKITIALVDANGRGPAVTRSIGELPISLVLPVEKLPEGDFRLTASIEIEKTAFALPRQTVSRVADPAARLAKLGELLDKTEKRSVAAETIRAHRTLLASLWEKQTFETDYAAAHLFADAEFLSQAVTAGSDDSLKKRLGQYWMTFPAGKGKTAVRLFAPDAVAKSAYVPLVIAMHGAGGSENLFFEGYGNGAIVKQCTERGWLLVAPRAGGGSTSDLIDEVAKLYPVDRTRVFLVGHSMGAMMAVSTVGVIPNQIAAVAALGGGGRVGKPETVKAVPFFIGCGDQDFAIGMARGLAKQLAKTEGISVEMKEYPEVEHLAVVQVALPDVFAFFDRIAKKKN